MPDISDEPLTLDEVKYALSLAADKDDHDAEVERMVIEVRQEAEKLCGIPIIATSKTIYLDQFPGGQDLPWWDGVRDGPVSANEVREIELPPGELRSVTSLTTYDDSDDGTVMSSDNYYVDIERNRIVLRSGQAWPTVARVANGIKIIAAMGWATADDVPSDMKARMKERLRQLWTGRGDPTTKLTITPWFYGQYAQIHFGRRNR